MEIGNLDNSAAAKLTGFPQTRMEILSKLKWKQPTTIALILLKFVRRSTATNNSLHPQNYIRA